MNIFFRSLLGHGVFRRFIALESSSGLLLMLAALLAMLCANVPVLAMPYHRILEPLEFWINDGLMAIFFFLVGMEIKRELKEGELSSPGQALLPCVAAIGGMLVPALIFAAFNGDDAMRLRGWAIPSATDIAFSLAILTLLGSRIPLGVKVFLTAVAIIDDLGAIVVIALFYTEHLSWMWGGAALLLVGMLTLLNLRGVRYVPLYLFLGALLWAAVLHSGVHATIAGVILGLTMPLRNVRKLEHRLHPWVAYGILPLFAFANAGLEFSGLSLARLADPVPAGIAAGLFFGKQIGIFAASGLLIALRIARLPDQTGWMQFYGVSILCGIGFTMSLFIGGLAYHDPRWMAEVRLGVMFGSFLSGIVGYVFLLLACKKRERFMIGAG